MGGLGLQGAPGAQLLCITHVLVRNDVRDVLQDQLGPLPVLVEFLVEHTGFEIPGEDKGLRGENYNKNAYI